MNSSNVTAFILAGGRSSRMGTDKGLMQFNNKQMISFVIDCVQSHFNSIKIISNNPAYNNFGYPVIEDEIKDIGPIGGILTGLKNSSTPWNFFIACDMPFVTSDVISILLKEDFDSVDAVIPTNNVYIEPLCAFYHKNTIDEIKNQIARNDHKMQHLISKLIIRKVDFSKFNKYNPFENINSKEDLEKIISK